MIVTNALLVVGVAYAAVQQRRKDPLVVPLSPVDVPPTDAEMRGIKQHAALSTLSLGLTVTGTLTALPLVTLFGVPLIVYTNVPRFEQALDTLSGKGERRDAIALSVLLGGLILSNHFVTASAVDWLVQRTRLATARLRRSGQTATLQMVSDIQQWVSQALGAQPEHVWAMRDGVEIEVPFADLSPGDEVLFRQGEIISVAGEVVWGEAELFDWSLVRTRTHFMAGDYVTPRMMVLSGELQVRVVDAQA